MVFWGFWEESSNQPSLLPGECFQTQGGEYWWQPARLCQEGTELIVQEE